MEVINLRTNKNNLLDGVLLIQPKIFSDKRGFFYESWNSDTFNKKITKKNFCQDNHSHSYKGVLRGMHYQLNPFAQGKLIRCIQGEIYDVAVDLRKKSKTFGKAIGITLSDKNHKQLWIPRGFAHGFLTISKLTVVNYKVDNYWNKNCEKTIAWNDDDLSIKWPLIEEDLSKLNLSNKDLNASKMNELEFDNLF